MATTERRRVTVPVEAVTPYTADGLTAHVEIDPSAEPSLETMEMNINMGPQHPSTHGVFRMVLALEGERVKALEPVIGYLHRGAEKLGESQDVEGYRKAMIWLDRSDYLSPWLNEHCYVMAVEKLAGITVPERAEYIRVIMSELSRVSSHCMFYGAFGADAGATTPFMYAFALREQLYALFEGVGGQRMFPNYFRPGGLRERSEEHTSELQSRQYLVCRLLLENTKKITYNSTISQ